MAREPGRLRSIQDLRGIASFLVVTTHARNMVLLSSAAAGPFVVGSAGAVGDFGASGVDLFFLISGFVMAYSIAAADDGPVGAARFGLLRLVRIAPPYWIVSAVLTIRLALDGGVDPRAIVNAVLFVPVADTERYTVTPLSIGWTLSFEVTFYVLVALLVLLRLSRAPLVLVGVIVALVALGIALRPEIWMLRWITNPMLLEFALGILVFIAWRRGWLARMRVVWAVVAVAGLLGLIVTAVVGVPGIAALSNIVSGADSLLRVGVWGIPMTAVLLGALAFAGGGRPGVVDRVLGGLGDASYSVYLVHLPVMVGVRMLLGLTPLRIPSDLLFLLLVAIGVASGLVYYRLVERPLTRWLRRRVEGAHERWARTRRSTRA